MQSPTWFCSTCGAANDAEQALCFACQQPRVEHTQQGESSGLHQGRYRLLTQVGVGGFGAVYKALDTQSADRVVAVKQINLRGLSPQKMIEATDAFNREVQILPPLKHPNLTRIYDHFTDPDHWYLVMEFLEGETLERYLETHRLQRSYTGTASMLPLKEIFGLAFQLCDVLEYLHTRQPPIIFRDLKPSNIMRSGIGHLYLIDFGIARLFTPGRSKDTTPLGSPGYAAPEQYGKAQTSPRSDLYSLGALLHHLVTGDDPSEAPFQFAPLPQTTAGGMPELEALIRRLVDLDSGQRPASARAVKEELQHIAYLASSSEPRIWYPPRGQTPSAEIVQTAFILPSTGQQQVQVQMQKNATPRRKFLTRSLLGGAALLLAGVTLGPGLQTLFDGQGFGQDQDGPIGFPDSDQRRETVSNIIWSPDGKQVAFVSTINSVRNDNVTTQNSVFIYQVGQGGGRSFSLSPHKRTASLINTLAWAPDDDGQIAFGHTDGSLTLWNINSAAPVITYGGSIGQVDTVAWSPDGTLIACGGVREAMRICRASDGKVISSYAGNTVSETRLLSWAPDSKRVVIESDQSSTLQVWDVRASKPLFTFAHVSMLQVAWSPDGNVIASLGRDRNVYLWNASHGTPIISYQVQGNSSVDSLWPVELLWSLDSKYLALDTGDADLQVWDVQNNAAKLAPLQLHIARASTWLADGRIATIDDTVSMQFTDVKHLFVEA